jgi:hypothetical protein
LSRSACPPGRAAACAATSSPSRPTSSAVSTCASAPPGWMDCGAARGTRRGMRGVAAAAAAGQRAGRSGGGAQGPQARACGTPPSGRPTWWRAAAADRLRPRPAAAGHRPMEAHTCEGAPQKTWAHGARRGAQLGRPGPLMHCSARSSARAARSTSWPCPSRALAAHACAPPLRQCAPPGPPGPAAVAPAPPRSAGRAGGAVAKGGARGGRSSSGSAGAGQ